MQFSTAWYAHTNFASTSKTSFLNSLDFERRSIQASAAVQQMENSAVSFHPGRNPESAFEIMRIFLEAGGKADRTIMSHLESRA